MYIYLITNLINNKKYVGQTNNFQRRMNEHRSGQGTVIDQAIKAYGVKNFSWEIIWESDNQNEINQKEQEFIIYYNSLVPNGYNLQKGGLNNSIGEQNPNAILTEDEAQWILDNRDKPIYLLYNEFSDKLTYEQFYKLYHHETYTNLSTNTKEYPYNREFSCQFTSGKLEYDDIVNIRKRYAAGEYWRDVYNDYAWACDNEWSFWNTYYGNRYKLVMPEVFTPENRKKHSSYKNQGSFNGHAKLTEEDVLNIR